MKRATYCRRDNARERAGVFAVRDLRQNRSGDVTAASDGSVASKYAVEYPPKKENCIKEYRLVERR
jgi:hypothetical protein